MVIFKFTLIILDFRIVIVINLIYIFNKMNTIDLHQLSHTNNQLIESNDAHLKPKTKRNFKASLYNKNFKNQSKNLTPISQRSNSICEKATQLQSQKQKLLLPYLSTLPKLNSAKSRNHIDKSYLQQWLDSALAEEQSNVPLKSIKKYQIDKRYLISQNLSQDQIDKLYHSLYMYTFGIKKLFQEILSNKQGLVMKFWKVFLKLLQKSSEYESIFQLIDLKHNQNIQQVRKIMRSKQGEFQIQKKQLTEKINGLKKQIVTKNQQIFNLIKQKNILQSHFHLTDEAFNQQVTLRLKFQQKINSINTAYAQLKNKYERIVDQIKIYKDQKIVQKKKQQQLIDELCEVKIKLKQNQKLLDIEKQKLKFKDIQITQIRQQIYDMKQEQLVTVKTQQNGQIQLQKYITREKNYKFRLNQQRQFKQALDKTVKQKTKQIETLTNTVKQERSRLYKQYKTVQILKQEINQKKKIIDGKEYQIQQLKKNIVQINQINKKHIQKEKQLQQIIVKLEKQCQYNSRKIQNLIKNQTANQLTISDLRIVRQKYQKLNNILIQQHNTIQNSLNQANNTIVNLKQQIRQQLMNMESKEYTSMQIQNRLQSLIQIQKSKVQSALNQLKQKDSCIQSLQLKIIGIKNQSDSKSDLIQKLKLDLSYQKNQTTKQIIERKNIEGKLITLQQENNKIKDQIENLTRTMLDSKKAVITLSNKNSEINYILQQRRRKIEQQSNAIKLSLNSYKKYIEERALHIHPMLYWDIQGQNDRLKLNYNKIIDSYKSVDSQIQKISNELNAKQQKITQYKGQLQKIKQEIIKYEIKIDNQKKNNKMNQQQSQANLKKLQLQLKKKDAQYTTIKNKCEVLDMEIKQIFKKKIQGVHIQLQTNLKQSKQKQIQTQQTTISNYHFPSQKNQKNQEGDSGYRILDKQKKQKQRSSKNINKNIIKQQGQFHSQSSNSDIIGKYKQNEVKQYKQYKQNQQGYQGSENRQFNKISNKQFTSALRIAYMRKI